MWKLLAALRSLFRKRQKPARWESIGSPSYQKAVRDLAIGYARKIRRKAWGEDRYLYVPDPNVHIYGDMTDGRWKAEIYPPRGPIRHVTNTAWWGKEYWQGPDEDINADDWQIWAWGHWGDMPAKGSTTKEGV